MTSSCSGNILVKTKKTWTINGEKGMTGTVEDALEGGLLWTIASPIQKVIRYGLSFGDIPATYVDINNLDQLAVIRNSDGIVYLDADYSGGGGELSLTISEASITYPNGPTYTARIVLPKYKCNGTTCLRDDISGTYLTPNCDNVCAPIDPTYRESLLTGCTITPSTAKPGDVISINLSIETGTKTENYRLKITGLNVSGTTLPFQIIGTVTATPKTITIPYTIPTAISYGLKNFTMELILA